MRDFRDLDEFTDGQLLSELQRRCRLIFVGKCSYCARLVEECQQIPCRLPRHTPPPAAPGHSEEGEKDG